MLKRTCRGHPLCLLGGGVGLLLIRSWVLGNEAHENRNGVLTIFIVGKRQSINGKEFDTYKVGTVANSCSTMHKIHAKEFTLEDFSTEHLYSDELDFFKELIDRLNGARELYLESKKKEDWWQMIQLLPSSYNQKRTVMLNYEVLANIYKSRKNHKLDEWKEHDYLSKEDLSYENTFEKHAGFCDWIRTLPYSELITGKEGEQR